MKKLVLILLLLPFLGCSSSSDDEFDGENDKTLVTLEAGNTRYPNTKIGYYDTEGFCKLIIDLGDFTGTSEPFLIPSKTIKEIIVFSDYGISEAMQINYAYQIGQPLRIEYGKSNKFTLSPTEFGSPVLKRDLKKYPH